MKLVIHTQCKENYGAHNWDGKGEVPQYWKFKGGSTYVVENITKPQMDKILSEGIPTLTKMIESYDEAFEEYIIDWEFIGDSETAWEEWQDPWVLKFVSGKWVATRQPSHWAKPVEESYTMLPEGNRENYGYVELGA